MSRTRKVDDTAVLPVLTPAAKAIGIALIHVSNALAHAQRAENALARLPERDALRVAAGPLVAFEDALRKRVYEEANK